jgi:DNA topoisomerase-1
MAMDQDGGRGQATELREAADDAGLTYVTDGEPGYQRRRAGKGFTYRDADGTPVTDPRTLKRIRSLVIPPAWSDVWICARADGHLQATGRDARGRKQYRYHPKFREVREGAKYEHLTAFAEALPKIRRTVAEHMAMRGLPREKVLATIVHLLETTLIRIGNTDYARQNRSYGLTTLQNPHVRIEGPELRFQFIGKSGKSWRLSIRDRRVAKVVKACQDLPGPQLFQYVDDEGERRAVTSSDVNAYLHEITGQDITAKDFRTWAGTVLAAMALKEIGAAENQTRAKKNIRAAIGRVAERLGNTVTICRKCYVHPEVVTGYLGGTLVDDIEKAATGRRRAPEGLEAEEAAVFAYLDERLARDPASERR